MYGSYKLRDLNIEINDIRIWTEYDGFYRYKRRSRESEIEKILLNDSEILLNPVEPVNLPKKITNYLFLHFEKPLVVEPDLSVEIFLTFPIEIGVFAVKDGLFEDIDIFSFVRPKFTLYGEPRGGTIARYWKTEVFNKIPEINVLEMGVMKLKILNMSDSWCEVSKAVFDVHGMKIYYNSNMVSSIAEMRIHSKRVAETSFFDRPIFENMKTAIELYTTRKIPILSTKFTMEWGT
ncbi:MAG: DUF432 domain-containing protein [Archaeoglobaceae archaeon]|nr:DUF432 domain-containing protein [Archaeoglobaceae archaeon]MDW7989715.1 DUF432 domain-containing protein [Archaeoglobaceae archaeon]